MSEVPSLQDLAVFLASYKRQQQYHSFASATWLVYDFLTTLDDEIRYVWRSANKLPKYLYLVSRYVGLFSQIILATPAFPLFCTPSVIIPFVLLCILLVSVEFTLILRVDALYNKSIIVRVCMGIAFVLEMATLLAINILSDLAILDNTVPIPPFLGVSGCLITKDSVFYKYSAIPTLVFEILIFGLNTFKCVAFGPVGNTPLLFRLFRDGTVYFAAIFSTSFLNVLGTFTPSPELANGSIIWTYAVLSYSGCHMLISMRKVAALRLGLPTITMSIWADPSDPSFRSSSARIPTFAPVSASQPGFGSGSGCTSTADGMPATPATPLDAARMLAFPPAASDSTCVGAGVGAGARAGVPRSHRLSSASWDTHEGTHEEIELGLYRSLPSASPSPSLAPSAGPTLLVPSLISPIAGPSSRPPSPSTSTSPGATYVGAHSWPRRGRGAGDEPPD